MARSLQPVYSLGGPRVVQIVSMKTELPWRQQPAIADWITSLIEATCEKAEATKNVRAQAMDACFGPEASHYFNSKGSAGPEVTFGLSASHESGATYVAFSNEAIAIDCCALDRADEILSAGLIAFSQEEFAMLEVSDRSLVHGWCAVECLCKLWGAGILQPNARPRLKGINPMTAEGTQFGSVGHVHRAQGKSNACMWATRTSSTWKEVAV